jgi:hypothetical protein
LGCGIGVDGVGGREDGRGLEERGQLLGEVEDMAHIEVHHLRALW